MKCRFFLYVVLLSFTLLTACTSHPPKSAQWPRELPSREYFVANYDADIENKKSQDLDEYLMWVLRFYQGWELYHNGWTRVTVDSLRTVTDPVEAEAIKSHMYIIGKNIAGEWAKNKKERRVLTKHVAVWGNALVESIKRGKELALVEKIDIDITNLLAERLSINDIKPERYFPADKDDVFSQ